MDSQLKESTSLFLQNKLYDLQEEVGVLKTRLKEIRKIKSNVGEESTNPLPYIPEEYSKITDPESKISFLEVHFKQSEQKRNLLESNFDSLLEDLHKVEGERDKWRDQYESSVILNIGQVPGASVVFSGSESGMSDIIHENHTLKKKMDSIYNEVKSQHDNYSSNDYTASQQSVFDEITLWRDKYLNLYNVVDEQMKTYSSTSTSQPRSAYSDQVGAEKSNVSNLNENKIGELHAQISTLKSENKTLKEEISSLSVIADSSNRFGDIHEESAQVIKLKEDKENWERKYELLQLDFVSATESYEREAARLTNELQELETKTSFHSKEIERLNDLLHVCEREDDAMAQQLTRSSEESLNFKEENSLLKEKIKMLMEQIQKQEETMNTLRDVAESDRKTMMEKIRKTESQMFQINEEHEFQTAALRTETEEKHKMTVELQNDLEKLTDRVSDLTTQLDIFREANSDKDEQISALNQDNRNLISKLQALNEEFKKLTSHWKDSMKGSYTTHDELQNEVDAWREKYESKELEFIEFRASHDVDVEQLMALSRASQVRIYESEKELESLKSQLDFFEGEEEERKCRLDDLVLENTGLKNSSKQLQRELDDYKLRVQYSLQVFPRGNSCTIL